MMLSILKINKKQYIAIDAKLRQRIFESTPYGENSVAQYLLQKRATMEPFKRYPYVFKWEYLVYPPFSNLGKGDLILADGKGGFLIVELKKLHSGTGKTARTSRNKAKKKVKKQAEYYARVFKRKHPEASVQAAWFYI